MPLAPSGRRVLLVEDDDDTRQGLAILLKSEGHAIAEAGDGGEALAHLRAHPATVSQVRELCAAGKMELRTFWELKGIHGDARVERVTIVNNKTKEEDTLAMDAVLPQLGFVSSLGAIAEWGLELEKHDIKVSQLMETSIPGIFAAGDITTYPGKLKLIATGAAEACVAVNHAVHFINPSAKVEPGHSSNMAIFGQADDKAD